MGTGYLKVTTVISSQPIQSKITIYNGDVIYHEMHTDKNGITETVPLSAPTLELSLDPTFTGLPYATYSVKAESPGLEPANVHGVRIFDTITSILPINLASHQGNIIDNEYAIPVHQLLSPSTKAIKKPEINEPLVEVEIPNKITIHMGHPDMDSPTIHIPYADYIKGVVSQAVFPTWPNAAIEACIYAAASLALNRVCTKWYKPQGFHITNTGDCDQTLALPSQEYKNINEMVDRITNRYIKRDGFVEPFFATYSDGRYTSCTGMWLWGAVALANRGYNALEILRYYYPADIHIVEADNISVTNENEPVLEFSGIAMEENTVSPVHTGKKENTNNLLALYLFSQLIRISENHIDNRGSNRRL